MKRSKFSEGQIACELRLRIRELAPARPRFGYLRIWVLLRREGWAINRKHMAASGPDRGRSVESPESRAGGRLEHVRRDRRRGVGSRPRGIARSALDHRRCSPKESLFLVENCLVTGPTSRPWEAHPQGVYQVGKLAVRRSPSAYLNAWMAPQSHALESVSVENVICNDDGEVDHFILGQMDGALSLQDIASRTLTRFPGQFTDGRGALSRVTDVSIRYSK